MHVLLLLVSLAAVGNAYNAKVPVQVLPERLDNFPGRDPSFEGFRPLPGRVPPQTLPGVVGVNPLVSPGRPGIPGSLRPSQRPGQYSFTRYNCRRQCPGYASGDALCCRQYGDCCGLSYKG